MFFFVRCPFSLWVKIRMKYKKNIYKIINACVDFFLANFKIYSRLCRVSLSIL